MSVRTDQINLNVNINGNVAQNKLNELRKEAADVAASMKGLKKGTQEYIDANKQLTQVQNQMADLKKEIGLTSLNEKELVAELRKLNALKGSVQPFSKEFKELQTQINATKNRLYDVRNGVTGLASVFSKISDSVKQFGVVAAGYLGFQFITSQFQSIIKGVGKMSDQLADLQRVSGLTAEQADNLSSSLKNLDTRTANGNLRDIAITAGKLGVAKDDILSFTKAVDQLVVSLGDELGDADQITTQLGKILNVFDGKITGDNITKLGNAFVELANTGAATGGFIAEFDQRLSGVAKSAGISLGALSGLGAGLEEMGSRVESSTTAIQKLIINISSDIPKAAQIAGQSAEEFQKLLKFDPTEAILKYSEGLVKSKESFGEVVDSLKDAGEEGARVIETISKLGSGADKLRERIDLGKKSIQESTAITEAFALKNENLGSEIDKLGKEFNRFVTSGAVVNFLKDAVVAARDFLKWMRQLPQTIDDNRGAFYTLVGAVILYNAAMIKAAVVTTALKIETIANSLATKAAAIATAIAETATAAYIVVTNLLTGKIKLATAAQRLWNIASSLGAGAIGVLIVAGIALVKILENIFSNNSKIAIQQKAQADLARKTSEAYGDQVNKLEILKKALEDENTSLETKKKAYQELIALNPDFVNTLKLDAQGHLEGAFAVDEYIKALKRKGEAEAAQNLSNEKNQQILLLQQEKYERSLKGDATINSGKGSVAFQFDISKIDQKIKELQTAKEFFDKKIVDALANTGTKEFVLPADTVPGGNASASEDSSVAARRKALEKMIEDSKVAYEKLNATDKAGQQANLDLRAKYQAELDALDNKKASKSGGSKNTEYERLKKEAEDFYKSLQKLKEDAANASKSDDEKELASLQQKYNELHAKALEYFKKNVTDRKTYTAEEKAIVKAFNNDLAALQKKQFENRSEDEYKQSIKDTEDYFDHQRNIEGQNYADGLQSKQQYDAEIKALDTQEKSQLLQVAQDYSKTSKTAASDVTKFKKDQEKEQTADAIAGAEARKKTAEQEAISKATLDVLKAPAGSKKQQEAQKALLQLQFDQDTQYLDKKSELYKEREAELQEALSQVDADYTQKRIDLFDQFAQETLSITNNLMNALNNLDQRALQRDKKINDAKMANFKRQLDHKLISQKQYDAKVAAAQAEMDKKKAEIDLKAFKRQQALAIVGALINGAVAITSTLAARPGLTDIISLGVFRAIQVGLVVAATAAQIAAISSQAPPEMGQGGLIENGPYHSDKSRGLPLINPETGQTEMLLEKDEGVVKGAAMRDKNKYTVSGTPSQIASKLNAIHGGVNWESGAQISPPRFMERPRQINPGMARIMAQGGVFRPVHQDRPDTYNDDRVVSMLDKILSATEAKVNRRSYVVLKDIEAQAGKYNAARRASGLG